MVGYSVVTLLHHFDNWSIFGEDLDESLVSCIQHMLLLLIVLCRVLSDLLVCKYHKYIVLLLYIFHIYLLLYSIYHWCKYLCKCGYVYIAILWYNVQS